MSSPLKPGYSVRPAALADAEAIADLLNRYWKPLLGLGMHSADGIRLMLTGPGFDIDTSTRVVVAPDGRLAGAAFVTDVVSPPVYPELEGCVGRDFECEGIGTYLLEWAEGRARQAVARVPDGVRVATLMHAPSGHEPTQALLSGAGMRETRRLRFMVIDLPSLPDFVLDVLCPVFEGGLGTLELAADVQRVAYHAHVGLDLAG